MYKNPSFATTFFTVQQNCIKHKGKDFTVTCMICLDGTMMLYDDLDELLSIITHNQQIPQNTAIQMLLQYLYDEDRYFFHKSFEYIPECMPTPEMEAKIMMFKEACLIQEINITPARKTDHSGGRYLQVQRFIDDIHKYESSSEKYYPGTMNFLKACHKNSWVDRMSHYCNASAVYCLKLDPPSVSKDPVVTFKDENQRLAVSRKRLHEFIRLYRDAMKTDVGFVTFVYPDGTAANMSGYDDMEINTMISNDDVVDYIRCNFQSSTVADAILSDINDEDCYFFKLQILRIVVIVGNNCAILPYPITPQQSVFLEGMQEFGLILVKEASVTVLDEIYKICVSYGSCKIPLNLTNGFMFNGSEYFVSYDMLSPDMKKKVESVMEITEDTKDDYLFDATSENNVLAISSEEMI